MCICALQSSNGLSAHARTLCVCVCVKDNGGCPGSQEHVLLPQGFGRDPPEQPQAPSSRHEGLHAGLSLSRTLVFSGTIPFANQISPGPPPRDFAHYAVLVALGQTCESVVQLRECGAVVIVGSTMKRLGSVHLKIGVTDSHFDVSITRAFELDLTINHLHVDYCWRTKMVCESIRW